MKRFVDGLHAVHTSRLQCELLINSSVIFITHNLRWYDSWSLGCGTKPSPYWHPSPCSPHSSRDRTESLEYQHGICHRSIHIFQPQNLFWIFFLGIAELKKAESDKLLDFFNFHIHSADDHYVRWKWTVGSVAMWDNRAVVHRVIPGTYKEPRRGVRTTVFGEKRETFPVPYFDLH